MKSKSGFTIVELLIVIVVIAILAAISIVAYNGIQERARASAVSSALNQATKKLKLYQVDNADQYPAAAGALGTDNLASLGITSSSDVTYQYSATATTFCLTATKGTTSYKVSNTGPTPAAGGCPGHGQGGTPAVTNLAINPSAGSTLTYWSTNTGNATAARDPAVARPGSATTGSIKTTFTVTGQASTQLWDGSSTPMIAVSPGESVTISGWVKSTAAGRTLNVTHRWRDGTVTTQVGQSASPVITLTGGWDRVTYTAQVPAGAAYDHVSFYYNGTAGDIWWLDDVMVTKGTTDYAFADGATTDWVWNGTPHLSTSTGPAQ